MEDLLAQIVPILAATLRVATPLVLCAMGGLFSERSGLIDVGLEGKMLAAAFAAAATAAVTGSPWLAVAAAILAAEALALLHGFACITYRGNQVVSGVAINILAAGLTVDAKARGLQSVGFFQMSSDGTRAYMADATDPSAPWAKTAAGDIAAAVRQDLQASSDKVANINQTQAQTLAQQQSNPMQDDPSPKGPKLA